MSSLTDYRKISVSLIATVFNEANNIKAFLESYKKQSIKASEFIIVDALSTDGTALIVKQFVESNPQLKIKLLKKESNRSQARNFAVSKAIGEYLAFTDGGCLLNELWLEELLRELVKSQKQVVGGFFQGLAKNKLEEAMVPYFLQLNKNVNEKNFTPTTRSFLIEKKLWQSMGGLNENLKLSEDYQLMLRIKQAKVKMAFAKKAIVYWYPPTSFSAFLKKIAGFAESDVEAGILRPKVLSIFARYAFFLFLFAVNNFYLLFTLILYLIWSIQKNKHNCPNSWLYLPVLQVSSDLMVMTTTLFALRKFNSRAF